MAIDPAALSFSDKTVIVTGAAAGIGRATALAFASLGARLAVLDTDAEGLAALAEQMPSGSAGFSSVVDARDGDGVEEFCRQAVETIGAVDVLINNAGGGFWAPFGQVSPNGERALIDENFRTVTNLVRSTVNAGRMNDGGAIVNVTSVEAFHAAPGFAVYAAMKAAVQQLTQSLAVELGGRGIRVNCVAPDMIPTTGDAALAEDSGARIPGLHDTPLRRSGTVDECAAVICFLASPLASFVTGTTIPVDGGTVAAGAWKVRHDGTFGM